MSDEEKMVLPSKDELKEELGLIDPEEIIKKDDKDSQLENQASSFVDKLLDFSNDNFDAQESSKVAVEVL